MAFLIAALIVLVIVATPFVLSDRRHRRHVAEAAARARADELVRTNAELEAANRELRAANRDLLAMARSSSEVASAADPDTARSSVCAAVQAACRAEAVTLFEIGPGGALTRTGVSGRSHRPGRIAANELSSSAREALTTRRAATERPVLADEATVLRGTSATLWQPVSADDHVIGLLAVDWNGSNGAPGQRRQALLEPLSDAAAAVLERHEALARLGEAAATDFLTGLANRRALQETLTRSLANARRDGSPICLALLDFDHFKRYNDQHGHPAGDEMLRDTARAWSSVMRTGDLLARFGGEEFAVVLHHCPLELALPTIERLREAIPEGTCSAGIAQFDGRESVADLIARCDAALYRAKEAGRDRVEVSAAVGSAAAERR